MQTNQIIRLVRWKEHDTDEVRFSDYEILAALNEVLRYIGQRLSNQQSDLLERTARYDVPGADYAEEGAALPDDFTSVKGVYRLRDHYRLHAASDDHVRSDTFRLSASRIYAAEPFLLLYYGQVGETITDGFIDLPNVFTDALVRLTRIVLNNADADVMTQAAAQELDAILPRRKWNNARTKLPFFV